MNLKIVLLMAFMLCVSTLSISAPAPPPTGGPGCWPPPCVPIDGGISLLIAAGAIYGGKTLYNKKKNKNSVL